MGTYGNGVSRSRKPDSGRSERRWEWIDYDLTAMDKDELRSLVESGDIQPDGLFDLVDAGFEVRLKVDVHGGGVRVMLIDADFDESPNVHVLTGRGSESRKATCALLYRHLVVAQEDWTLFLTRERTSLDYD